MARSLQERPVAGARVLLVSTGSEESFMEGMQAFARRHFHRLPRDRTLVVCVDTVGSPELVLLEGEGMLRMREYPEELKALVAGCAEEARHPAAPRPALPQRHGRAHRARAPASTA